MNEVKSKCQLLNITTYHIFVFFKVSEQSDKVCIEYFRYGGLSFGEINDLIQVNDSVLGDSIHRILATANGGERANVTVSLPNVVRDLEDILELGVTRRNGKVSDS